MAGTSDFQIKAVILELAKNNPDGIYNDKISAASPDTPTTIVADAINKLIEDGSLKLFINSDKVPFYKPTSATPIQVQLKDLKMQEEVVFRLINDVGCKGIWAKEISAKLHLTKIEQNKVLKSLISKKLIKDIVVPGNKLKCYILHNLEHECTKTDQFWYVSQDQICLNTLIQWCMDYLENKAKTAREAGGGPLIVRDSSYVEATEVYQYITETKKFNTSKIAVSNVENILYTFVLDSNAERIKNAQGAFLYKISSRWLSGSGIITSPCCGCRVTSKCGKVGSITPQTCKYFDEWLEK